jgi:ribonucleotide monophosphatase NagD (HAD superfamily)
MQLAEKSVIFVTNNATKARQDYKSKFDKLGIQAQVVRDPFRSKMYKFQK